MASGSSSSSRYAAVEATTRSTSEEKEQPASGAEERGHAEEADAAAGALTWQELFSGWGGGHYEAGRGGFGRWFRKDRRASGGWGLGRRGNGRNGGGRCIRRAGGLSAQFAAAWDLLSYLSANGYLSIYQVVW